MALTCYCKKCKADVSVGDICPQCGGKLPPSSRRVVWCVPHVPVKDWLCWNASARIVLPVLAVLYLLILMLEGASGGAAAITALLRGGLTQGFVWMLVVYLLGLLLVLCLQGQDLKDCVVDSKGLHVQTWLPNPTPLKLALRGKSPRLMDTVNPENPILPLSTAEIPYKEIARIQLWPEKTLILVYGPAKWLRLALYCSPFSWTEALAFLRDKVGKKKNLLLPRELVVTPPPRAKKPRAPKAAPAPQPVFPEAVVVGEPEPVGEAVPPEPAQEEEPFAPAEAEGVPPEAGEQGDLFAELGMKEEG